MVAQRRLGGQHTTSVDCVAGRVYRCARQSKCRSANAPNPTKARLWLGVLGNFGVIAGLVLLAYELRQNSNLIRAQTRHELAAPSMVLPGALADNPHLSQILTKSLESWTPAERLVIRGHHTRTFHHWVGSFYQYRVGLYDEAEFRATTKVWQRVLAPRAGALEWCFFRELAPLEFVAIVDDIFERGGGFCLERQERLLHQDNGGTGTRSASQDACP
jgi:hypothetical protein